MAQFPIDLGTYRRVALCPDTPHLSAGQLEDLRYNVRLCREAIVLVTSLAEVRGLGGHSGGPYDTVPELVLFDAICRGAPQRVMPVLFDAAGHRVASQYLLAALRGHIPAAALLTYREPGGQLPGHPERGVTPGLDFSSGRLGHLWAAVNGVALANPGRAVVCLSSDGSLQEGGDAEAARFCVAHRLNLKLLVDDNDSTCSGHPSDYMPGYDVARTLVGHGLDVDVGDGEDLQDLHARLCRALAGTGPVVLVNRRPMCPGIAGVEGTFQGHDALSARHAIPFLRARGHEAAARILETAEAHPVPRTCRGPTQKTRHVFDRTVAGILSGMLPEERRARAMCVDSDLGDSCGIVRIGEACPEIFVKGGIMERACFSAAAGFGMAPGKQGIYGTYSTFLEMVVSEITMARLNQANVLCNLSHSGVDDLADNTCHFGLNHFFADGGLDDGHPTWLFYPADGHQMRACVEAIFDKPGLRFVFSSRAAVPDLLDINDEVMFGAGYRFEIGKDDIIREGCDGYILSFGECLYRCLTVIDRIRDEGISVGLINKSTLNVPDEESLARMGRAPFVLVVEALNRRTGLGMRVGTWLLERGYGPRYAHLGTHRAGCGGLAEQMPHQGLDEAGILAAVRELHAPRAGAAAARAIDRETLHTQAARVVALPGAERIDLAAPPAEPALPAMLRAKLGPFAFQTPFAAEIRGVRLVGPEAVGFAADGRAILETTVDRTDILGRCLAHIAPERREAPATRRLGLVCSLVDLWSPLYAHWLLEGLTRLEALEAYVEATGERPVLVIDADPPAWKRDSLRLMGVDPDACAQWDGGPVDVERLVICSKRREEGRASPRAVRRVRDRVLSKLGPGPSPDAPRLYISRGDARVRQVLNEDAVLAALGDRGFVPVRLDGMPWPDQVRLFRQAETVVAPHGAGLTNIIFADDTLTVVELFGQKISHFHFTCIQALGFDYRALVCEPAGDHMVVDIEALLRLLDERCQVRPAPMTVTCNSRV